MNRGAHFRRFFKVAVPVGVLSVFILLFQNCSEQAMTLSLEPTEFTDPRKATVSEVLALCQSAEVSTTLLHQDSQLTFSEPPESNIAPDGSKSRCVWSDIESDLKNMEEEHHGYIKQRVFLDLPQGAYICKISFSSEEQDVRYDDDFVFSFDDYILASNSTSMVNLMHSSSEFSVNGQSVISKVFSWPDIEGHSWPSYGTYDPSFCLGKDLGSKCVWPASQSYGPIGMNFPPELLLQMAHHQFASGSLHYFDLVVTGDNNPDRDCNHSPLNFTAKVSYVIPPTKTGN